MNNPLHQLVLEAALGSEKDPHHNSYPNIVRGIIRWFNSEIRDAYQIGYRSPVDIAQDMSFQGVSPLVVELVAYSMKQDGKRMVLIPSVFSEREVGGYVPFQLLEAIKDETRGNTGDWPMVARELHVPLYTVLSYAHLAGLEMQRAGSVERGEVLKELVKSGRDLENIQNVLGGRPEYLRFELTKYGLAEAYMEKHLEDKSVKPHNKRPVLGYSGLEYWLLKEGLREAEAAAVYGTTEGAVKLGARNNEIFQEWKNTPRNFGIRGRLAATLLSYALQRADAAEAGALQWFFFHPLQRYSLATLFELFSNVANAKEAGTYRRNGKRTGTQKRIEDLLPVDGRGLFQIHPRCAYEILRHGGVLEPIGKKLKTMNPPIKRHLSGIAALIESPLTYRDREELLRFPEQLVERAASSLELPRFKFKRVTRTENMGDEYFIKGIIYYRELNQGKPDEEARKTAGLAGEVEYKFFRTHRDEIEPVLQGFLQKFWAYEAWHAGFPLSDISEYSGLQETQAMEFLRDFVEQVKVKLANSRLWVEPNNPLTLSSSPEPLL